MTLMPHAYRDLPSVAAQIDLMREAGSKAVWLCNEAELPATWYYGEILEACDTYTIPVFVHRDRIRPGDLYTLCNDYPTLRVVLVGAGYREDYWLYPAMRSCMNLRVCLGHFYIPPYGPMRFLEEFAADRLLFGSGLPGFSPGGLIAHVTYADIDDDAKAAILAGNTRRLLEEVEL
jgi:predicted TIM-barrel fold metal-dependent hydrolase